MNCTYYLIRGSKDINGSVCFGIAAVSEDNRILAVAHDVSRDENRVAQLVDLCNPLGLSIIHFNEVIEDFIG